MTLDDTKAIYRTTSVAMSFPPALTTASSIIGVSQQRLGLQQEPLDLLERRLRAAWREHDHATKAIAMSLSSRNVTPRNLNVSWRPNRLRASGRALL